MGLLRKQYSILSINQSFVDQNKSSEFSPWASMWFGAPDRMKHVNTYWRIFPTTDQAICFRTSHCELFALEQTAIHCVEKQNCFLNVIISTSRKYGLCNWKMATRLHVTLVNSHRPLITSPACAGSCALQVYGIDKSLCRIPDIWKVSLWSGYTCVTTNRGISKK